MNKIKTIFFLLILADFARSQKDTLLDSPLRWIDKKVPAYQSVTIDGKHIDSNYFKGKITIICFFGFNCAPCRQELSLLSDLDKNISKEKCQILMLGDASEKDLNDLRSRNSKTSGKWKRKLGIDTLTFDLVSDCPNIRVSLLMRACKGAAINTFKVYANPTTFFVNQEGIVKKVFVGFSIPRNKKDDEYFYSTLKELEK